MLRCFTYFTFNQLQSNQVGGNGAEAACVPDSAGQVVNYIPCQPTGVREVEASDHQFFRFSSKWDSKPEADELGAPPCGVYRKNWLSYCHSRLKTIYRYFLQLHGIDNFASAKMVL